MFIFFLFHKLVFSQDDRTIDNSIPLLEAEIQELHILLNDPSLHGLDVLQDPQIQQWIQSDSLQTNTEDVLQIRNWRSTLQIEKSFQIQSHSFPQEITKLSNEIQAITKLAADHSSSTISLEKVDEIALELFKQREELDDETFNTLSSYYSSQVDSQISNLNKLTTLQNKSLETEILVHQETGNDPFVGCLKKIASQSKNLEKEKRIIEDTLSKNIFAALMDQDEMIIDLQHVNNMIEGNNIYANEEIRNISQLVSDLLLPVSSSVLLLTTPDKIPEQETEQANINQIIAASGVALFIAKHFLCQSNQMKNPLCGNPLQNPYAQKAKEAFFQVEKYRANYEQLQIQKKQLRDIQQNLAKIMEQTSKEQKDNKISHVQISNDIIAIYEDLETYYKKIKKSYQDQADIGDKLDVQRLVKHTDENLEWAQRKIERVSSKRGAYQKRLQQLQDIREASIYTQSVAKCSVFVK